MQLSRTGRPTVQRVLQSFHARRASLTLGLWTDTILVHGFPVQDRSGRGVEIERNEAWLLPTTHRPVTIPFLTQPLAVVNCVI